MDGKANSSSTPAYELRIMRVFDAPRELVWKAWTDPAMAMNWMGPRGFTATEFVTPAKAGERWRLSMEGQRPGSEQLVTLKQGGVVKELRPPELMVYTFAWDDRSSVGLGESPYKENIVTVRFEEEGNKTVMHFTQGPFATEGERDGHTGGWNSAFDCFAEFILSEQPGRPASSTSEVHLRRVFAAPREMVFKAWTDSEQMAQWWGPRGFTNQVCEIDARGGGKIYVEMRAPDGTVYPMTGRFIEVYPPYRFHFTTTPLHQNGKALFETWTSVFFAEVEGGTEVVLDVHVTKSTPEAAPYLKGMNAGWTQSLDRLGELLAAGQQRPEIAPALSK
jgi:uncharacterized protein YndB with AHSA1/START domain